MMLYTLVFACLLSTILCCPPQDQTPWCICKTESFFSQPISLIACSGLDNDHDMMTTVEAFKNIRNIFSFAINDSVLNYIPHDTFRGLRIPILYITNSSLSSVSDTDKAFEGLEDSLTSLGVIGCTLMGEWKWSKLNRLYKLFHLIIKRSGLTSIEEDISEMRHIKLTGIDFSENDITWIYDYAFVNFTGLITLNLSKNKIFELKRVMFPNPAPKFSKLDLSYNEIEQLPVDIFTNMPSLQVLSIAHNRILNLDEKVFDPVWGGLHKFNAEGNVLICDCRMSWILKRSTSASIKALCSDPPALKGKGIKELESKDLWCWLHN